MLDYRWHLKPYPETEKIQKLEEAIHAQRAICTMLIQRGVENFSEAENYFNPSLEHLHDPFLMKNMQGAVERLQGAMETGEYILIYGDYDVDGTTSVTLVYGFLKSKGYENISYYIPDRYAEGYGISFKGIDVAEERGASLIVALDCGIKAVDKVKYANEKGIDFIICDHHTPGAVIPAAKAILNPKQEDCPYPYKELSGCGIGFKFMQGLAIAMDFDPQDLYQYLDLVAVSIGCDIVAMTGENRTLCAAGLKKVNEKPMPGIEALIGAAKYEDKVLNVRDLVFGLGPRINAAGRIDHAHSAVELLLENDASQAGIFSAKINTHNEKRRDFDTSMTVEAVQMIADSPELASSKSTVLYKEDWHKGVIGIVASRCIEHYHRPTIIFTKSNDKLTGSARSVPEFNIYEAILSCEDLLESFGGHAFAAGLTLKEENYRTFIKRFEARVASTITDEQLMPKIDIDLEIQLIEINSKLLIQIARMAPFGPQNMQPVFLTRGVVCFDKAKLLKDKHLKFSVIQENSKAIACIAFDMADKFDVLFSGEPFDICYSLTINDFRGVKTIQLNIRDIKTA